MHLDIDRFADYNSPLHSWDPRHRIVSLFFLIICVSFLKYLPAVWLSVIIVFIILLISSIPLKKIGVTLFIPVLLLSPLFIVLPLTSGGTFFYIFGVRFYEEGARLSAVIGLKALCIITLFILLTGTSPFNNTMRALRSLRVPAIMADIILFAYRYIYLYLDDLRTLRQSLILRGYTGKGMRRSFRTSASLIGSLLVRSFEQTERIFNAMTCRGYTGRAKLSGVFRAGPADYIKSAAVVITAAVIIFVEYYFNVNAI